MSRHTPGPYTIEDVNSDHLHDICLAYDVPKAGHPVLVATVFYDEDGAGPITLAQATANARLFAAAPDLLLACETVLKSWFDSKGEAYGEDMRLVEAAIRKAKGGAK
jgi:hypothetical protein